MRMRAVNRRMKCILWLASGIAAKEISNDVGKRLKAHLVGGNTRADCQLCLIENPLTHPPDTFVWIQVVLCAILRDTGMNQLVRKHSPGAGESNLLQVCFIDARGKHVWVVLPENSHDLFGYFSIV